MANFCKNETCPSSQELLAFQNGDLESGVGRVVREHLRECEFCSAEVEFYAHYPQIDEPVEAAEIPTPLLQLAEALLRNREKDHSSLDQLLHGDEEIASK